MPSPYFDFRRFRIYHDRCAMKVNTDAVLLGAWADISLAGRVLDIGCGTGLIAIMAAQRSEAFFTGVEIDSVAATQAAENVAMSPFSSRVEIVCSDIRTYESECLFDAILSNPPFFEEQLLPPDKARSLARHTDGLSFSALLDEVKRLLLPGGDFHVVVPHAAVNRLLSLAAVREMSMIRRLDVITRMGKAPKRTLLTLHNTPVSVVPETNTLVLTDEQGKRTQEYSWLTKDYYL